MPRPATPSSYSDAPKRFVSRLVQLRTDAGLTQADLAKLLQANGHPAYPSTIAKLEVGERRPTLEDVCALADVFSVPTGTLVGATPDDEAAWQDRAARVVLGDRLQRTADALQAATALVDELRAAYPKRSVDDMFPPA